VKQPIRSHILRQKE